MTFTFNTDLSELWPLLSVLFSQFGWLGGGIGLVVYFVAKRFGIEITAAKKLLAAPAVPDAAAEPVLRRRRLFGDVGPGPAGEDLAAAPAAPAGGTLTEDRERVRRRLREIEDSLG